MKITIKAILINVSEDKASIIENMMIVFCTAIRYSFKRLLEGSKIGKLEKELSQRYKLNIRQAKDAAESARQSIASQRELVKLNYNNYLMKFKAVQRNLQEVNLSYKKRNALRSKLAKRQRKVKYFKKFVDSGTIPPVIFGSKEMFVKRCKNLISHEEWVSCRNNRIYSRGDKTKLGNPNLRVVLKNGMTYLEISTLEKTEINRAVKIQVPIYIPQKLSKKTGKVNGINYRELFFKYLETNQAYQVEIIKRDKKYYCYITFERPKPDKIYTRYNGIIGIDTNPDGFALTMIGNKGNYKWHKYLKQHELLYARGNNRNNLCGELVKHLIDIIKEYKTGIAVEDLKFKDDIDVKRKFARVRHGFIYSRLLGILESACLREGIEIVKVKPQFTSKIGLYKYCHQYGMDIHNGAALVIGRRSYNFKERVPKILKDKLVKDVKIFDKKNDWSKWNYINRNLLKIERQVKNPGFWIEHRKELLSIL